MQPACGRFARFDLDRQIASTFPAHWKVGPAQGAINYVINIFNLSISTGQMPEIWHKGIIIQILKHGKDNNIGMNWRPISLLCPADKMLE